VNEAPPDSHTALRMILGRQLHDLREKAGLSYEQAAEAIYASAWTIRRMERAEGGLKPLSVKGLLAAYGITDAREVDAFLALAREASKPGWWHNYSDVLPTSARTAGPSHGAGRTAVTAWKPSSFPAAAWRCASPPTRPDPPSSWSRTRSGHSLRAPRPAWPTTCSADNSRQQ
jgi:transcriptional regulator with XRE-family HTH domain